MLPIISLYNCKYKILYNLVANIKTVKNGSKNIITILVRFYTNYLVLKQHEHITN